MEYVFVGTEQDLFENGFILAFDDEVTFIKRTNEGNVFIDTENNVLTFNVRLISDLLEKGLVVKKWKIY